MSLKDINEIKIEYRNKLEDVVENFYVPVLSNGIVYKRAVGYFSSEILIKISKGIGGLIKNGGTIQLLISPNISKEDFEVLKNSTSEIIDKYALSNLYELIENESRDRLSLLYYLLNTKRLLIKFAIIKDNKQGLYHEKLGVVRDNLGDMVVFSGSANETGAAIELNYEAIDVFCSWNNPTDYERCVLKNDSFDRLWNGEDFAIDTIDLGKAVEEKLLKYKNDDQTFVLDIDEYYRRIKETSTPPNHPKLPIEKKFFEYQKLAITNWKDNNYVGIYDMATGTGKTFTALGSIVELFDFRKKLFVLIIVPFIHLVDQWEEEASQFNINPTLIYSANKNWKEIVKKQITWFGLGVSKFECLITTNASFTNPDLQDYLSEIKDDLLIIVDEAHNIGTANLASYLKEEYNYRLALSATIKRHNDIEGTQRIFDYFQKKVITISLKDAIKYEFLTPYKYYPIIVYLNDDEREQYYDLSEKISKIYSKGKIDQLNSRDKELLKILLLKRSKVVAGAKNKISSLVSLINKDFKNEKNMLIYCGSVIYKDGEIGIDEYENEIRQIEIVIRELYEKNKMIVDKFTSFESKKERIKIKEAFVKGDLQGLVAIKCLDEGVNIPAIKTAFILASSSNPREYVQRRGRVLRKFPGKEFSQIFDFITLSRPLHYNYFNDANSKKIDSQLAQKELIRIKDFVEICDNPSYCNDIINNIEKSYNLNDINLEDGDNN